MVAVLFTDGFAPTRCRRRPPVYTGTKLKLILLLSSLPPNQPDIIVDADDIPLGTPAAGKVSRIATFGVAALRPGSMDVGQLAVRGKRRNAKKPQSPAEGHINPLVIANVPGSVTVGGAGPKEGVFAII